MRQFEKYGLLGARSAESLGLWKDPREEEGGDSSWRSMTWPVPFHSALPDYTRTK